MAKIFVLSAEHESVPTGSKAYPTATLAKSHASDLRKKGVDSEIEQVETPDGLGLRETACALYNREEWVGKVETIQTLKGIKTAKS